MSLYPVMAVLCGVVLERCAFASPASGMNRGWRQFVLGLSGAGVVGGLVVCVIALGGDLGMGRIQIPPIEAWCFLAFASLYMAWMAWHLRSRRARDIQWAGMGVALLFGIVYAGPIVSSLIARQPEVEELLGDVRERLPDEEALVSFGGVTHAFAYYYGEFIPNRPWPEAADEDLPRYFCCRKQALETHPLPFAWEAIAEMSFEDDVDPSPGSYIVVGRRLPAIAENPSVERK
jgi:hypothetical protein